MFYFTRFCSSYQVLNNIDDLIAIFDTAYDAFEASAAADEMIEQGESADDAADQIRIWAAEARGFYR
jgi:hypothetical protein